MKKYKLKKREGKNMLNLPELAGNIQKLLILQAVHKMPKINGAEIYELASLNGIKLSVDNVPKLLTSLLEEEYIDREESLYQVTVKGKNRIIEILDNLNDYLELINSFKSYNDFLSDKAAVCLDSLYDQSVAFKTLPYTLKMLDAEEDDFFLSIVPERGMYYDFAQRGLGKGDWSNFTVLFVNNRLIKYVGVIDNYIDDKVKGIKRMYLKDIHKLSVPISEEVLRQNVRGDFRFIRNRQDFFEDLEVISLKKLLSVHW